MRAQKERDTSPEMLIRRQLHAVGLRYRLHRRIPGTRREIDIALVQYRIAVFVDGCFWHGCPEHGTLPKTNRAWWQRKLATNRSRDIDTNARLAESGWTVVRIWEHEDPGRAAISLIATVDAASRDTVHHRDSRET